MSEKPKRLPPPDGFASWLDYAIATMDTRVLFNRYAFDEMPGWEGRDVQRDNMRAAAAAELAELREENKRLRAGVWVGEGTVRIGSAADAAGGAE